MTHKSTDRATIATIGFKAGLWRSLLAAFLFAAPAPLLAADQPPATAPDDPALNFHLMHPGGPSLPGGPNAAFYLDGTYHLHYILAHPWDGKGSFSFVHVTSPDMLHWTWQPTYWVTIRRGNTSTFPPGNSTRGVRIDPRIIPESEE